MTETESKHLRHLLTAFDARALGEGDETTGINLLAAMAITLANLARPGSGIRTPDGRLINVGCNLLAAGARTTNMVLDDVVGPVDRCQDNLLGQLARLVKNDKAEDERALRNLSRRWILSKGQTTNAGENSLFQLMTGSAELDPLFGSHEDQWIDVVGSAPSEHFGELVRRPRAFFAAATPALLAQQLAGVHRGQALMTIGLSCAANAAKFGKLCPSLMDGLIPAGPSGETFGFGEATKHCRLPSPSGPQDPWQRESLTAVCECRTLTRESSFAQNSRARVPAQSCASQWANQKSGCEAQLLRSSTLDRWFCAKFP